MCLHVEGVGSSPCLCVSVVDSMLKTLVIASNNPGKLREIAAKIDEIKSENWSRIPIFDANLTTSHGLLLMKDLVDIDFDERAYKISELPLKKTKLVGSKTALDTMFRKFIAAHAHLVPIERNDKIVGILTIEDLIEEILGHEIEDESDE